MKHFSRSFLIGIALSFGFWGGTSNAAERIAFISQRDGNSEIYSMNADGTDQVDLTNSPSRNENDPTASPNGEVILYGDGQNIWTMKKDGSNQTAITTDGNQTIHFDFNPNGTEALYSQFFNGDWDIYTIPVTGGTPNRVVDNQYGDYEGDWSPDGRKIVFKGFPDSSGREEIYVRNADGSNQVRLTTTGGNNNPRYSPDGSQIIFDSKRDSGQPQIFIMNADGSNQRRLTSNTFADLEPLFSPDGTKITFTSNRDGNYEIYVMDADGKNALRLTNNSAQDSNPIWLGATPTLKVSDASVTEGDTGTTNLNFQANLSFASTDPVTFTVTSVGGTATVDEDYATVNQTVTIPAGLTSKTFSISIKGDSAIEPDETIALRLSNLVNASPAFEIPDRAANRNPENGHLYELVNSTQNFGGARDGAAAHSYNGTAGHLVTITSQAEQDFLSSLYLGDLYWIGGIQTPGSTEPAGGFTWITGEPFAFTAWQNGEPNDAGGAEGYIQTNQSGQWNDNSYESLPPYYVVEYDVNAPVPTSPLEFTGTIINDDYPLVSVSVDSISSIEGNTGTTPATFTVSLSAASKKTVTVHYATADSSAKSGVDYTVASGDLTFQPGETTKTVTVSILGDLLDEPDEGFTLNLSAPSNATLGGATGKGKILDDDATPSLSIQSEIMFYEGRTAANQPTLAVNLSAASSQTVTVKYSTSDGKAKAPGDYTRATGTLTFAPGETQKNIQISIVNDNFNEAPETFQVTLSVPFQATLKNKVATATIIDDDSEPSFLVSDSTVKEGKSQTVDALFTISLSAPSNRPTSVKYATADDTAIAGLDYDSSPSKLLIFAPHEVSKTIKIRVRGDDIDEPNERFFVNLFSPVNADIADKVGIGTILDDDDTPTLSVNNVSTAEGNIGSKSLNFTVTLSRSSSSNVTVKVNTADALSGTAATAGVDYTALPLTTVTFAPGERLKTVAIKISGDTLDEDDETLALVLSGAVNANLAQATAIGTIMDDDVSPKMNIGNVTLTEGNSGFSLATFTVSLSAPSARVVTASFATADGSATSASDYVKLEGNLSFAPGVTSQTIVIQVKTDTIAEPRELFAVRLTGSTGATLGQKTGIGTILDDDSASTAGVSAKSS